VESVAVSLDGPERVHDSYRQEGSNRRAQETIIAFTGAGIPTSVISALRADNAPLLPELYETLRGYPIFAWQLQACSPMGNARDNELDVGFSAQEVIDFVLRTAPNAPFAVGIADNIGYYVEGEQEGLLRGGRGGYYTGCGAGLTSIGIDSVGNVRGCESMYDPAFIEGNLRTRSLRSIWLDPNAFAYNRDFTPDLLGGKCATCPHGHICAGGCRSYNFFTNADKHLYRSPICARNEEHS
ncbi:MAG: SPASM domain-containing protein, partial [Clostridia bacterium]|nr:SPASM domain-containing protein [Clostridia bacterium]